MLDGLNGGVEYEASGGEKVCVSACMCWVPGFMCVLSKKSLSRPKGQGCMESKQMLRETVNKETTYNTN